MTAGGNVHWRRWCSVSRVTPQGQEAIGEAMRRTSQSEHVDSGVEGRGSQGEGEEPFEIIDSDELPIPSTTHQEYHERGQEVKEEMAGVRQRRN